MTGVALAASIMVAAAFVLGGGLKLRYHADFRDALTDYRVLPTILVVPVARAVPLLEIGLGVTSVLPATRRPGQFGLLTLLVAFSGAVLVNLARGRRDISCACFGRKHRPLGRRILLRNGGMGLSLILTATASASQATPRPSEAIVAALGLICCWVMWEASNLVTPPGLAAKIGDSS